jgi:hypothetical protein
MKFVHRKFIHQHVCSKSSDIFQKEECKHMKQNSEKSSLVFTKISCSYAALYCYDGWCTGDRRIAVSPTRLTVNYDKFEIIS